MHILGMDEVGRGCWAGPLVVGAVVLGNPIEGLRDSKLLSKSRRESFAILIKQQAVSYGLGWVSPAEIDDLGLTESICVAYERALSKIRTSVDKIIIDGNYNFLRGDKRVSTQVKADQTMPSVSAASIIAKVARDDYMRNMATAYPMYGFERHVGYGTSMHRIALRQFGPCILHRRSFRPISAVLATL